ncbi:hypothetical protein FNT36_24230 [Hymenobacter setariae]|jgi:hypothetical protein|uniref:Uncharacterized protein n=1 Tax=Hymenobacter setariae TaxID=2594794 RepID=A0A558BKE0_9BACT|nr:hypothetical protein [Hymenobacter setariae]TVT36979.1 hypothetical protein FNT36_24230 [Hymenobacter setariae]
MSNTALPQRQAPDWATETNQYDLRLRWPDGRRETRMLTGRPRLGPDAELEFRANWAGLAEDAPATAYPAVLSITDVALQVTYLPTVQGPLLAYFHNSYTIPDRRDNCRYFDCQLVSTIRPGEVRGYSFEVSAQVADLDIPQELRREHRLLKGPWRLVPRSLREIFREQHHYLTWQRRQQPDYYLPLETQEARQQHLTAAQARLVVRLVVAGYVLRANDGRWEVGAVAANGTYRCCTPACATPVQALGRAVELGLVTAR